MDMIQKELLCSSDFLAIVQSPVFIGIALIFVYVVRTQMTLKHP